MQFSITPWHYDAATTALCLKATALHAAYAPLISELAQAATTSGWPIVRPLFWADPTDLTAAAIGHEFLLGSDVLVAPVMEKGCVAGSAVPRPGARTPLRYPATHCAGSPLGASRSYTQCHGARRVSTIGHVGRQVAWRPTPRAHVAARIRRSAGRAAVLCEVQPSLSSCAELLELLEAYTMRSPRRRHRYRPVSWRGTGGCRCVGTRCMARIGVMRVIASVHVRSRWPAS